MKVFEQSVDIFLNHKSKSPFERWFEGIKNPRSRILILNRVNRLRLGNFGECKNLSGGIYELKFATGPGYRIYFAKTQSDKILILYGGTKRTQAKDISKAKSFLKQYRER